MKKKNKYLRLLLAIGVLILIITPFATVAYGTDWKALYIDIPTEIKGEGGSVLEFEIHNWTATHFLRIYLAVQPMMVGATKTLPLLNIAMFDQSNMTLIEDNQTPTYAFFRAYGIENSTYFDVKSLNQSGKYYMVIFNAIPYNTTGLTTIVEGWTGWTINPLLYPLMTIGLCLALPIILIPRIKSRS